MKRRIGARLDVLKCEAKGWECLFVDGDVNKRLAWHERQADGSFSPVSELRCLKGLRPEQIAEIERR